MSCLTKTPTKQQNFHQSTPVGGAPWSHAESRLPLPVQPGLGFALGLRAAGTVARLLLQGSARYVAAQQELRTTGVRRSGRINVLV